MESDLDENSQAQLWKKMIEIGVFDNYFPHRVNACFNYLDGEGKHYFVLQDLIQKGPIVFEYLSFEADYDSSFAMMDTFRKFDNIGTGSVGIEEFSIGIINKLIELKNNEDLMLDISNEIYSKFDQAIKPFEAWTNKLEKDKSFLDQVPKFKFYMKSLVNLIIALIKSKEKPNNISPEETKVMIHEILVEAVEEAINELKRYFHITDSRLLGMSPSQEFLAHQSSNEFENDESSQSRNKHVLFDNSVWNLMGNYMQDIIHDEKSLIKTTKDIDVFNDNKQGRYSNDENIKRNVEENSFKQIEISSSTKASTNDSVDLKIAQMFLSINEMVDINKMDEVQVFLLQNAFQSLSNFFFLLDNPNELNFYEDMFFDVKDMSMKPNDYKKKSPQHTMENFKIILNEIFLNSRHQNLPKQLSSKEGELHSSVPFSNPDFQLQEDYVISAELELSKQLFQTQEKLRKTQLRLSLLELIRGQMATENLDEVKSKSMPENTSENDLLLTEFNSNVEHSLLESKENTLQSGSKESYVVNRNLTNILGQKKNLLSDSDILPTSINVNDSPSRFYISENSNDDNDGGKWIPKDEEQNGDFDQILQEISSVKNCLAERASTKFPFGYFLENEAAIVNYQSNNIIVPQDQSKLDSIENKNGEPKVGKNDNHHTLYPNLISQMNSMASELEEIVFKRSALAQSNEILVKKLRDQDEKIAEYKTLVEQIEEERFEFASLNVELQLLKEKNQKLLKEDEQNRVLSTKVEDLTQKKKELEEIIKKLLHEQKHLVKKNHSSSMKKERETSSSSSYDNELQRFESNKPSFNKDENDSNIESSNLGKLYSELELKYEELVSEHEKTLKENLRVKNSLKVSEHRVKTALQDQMALHNQLQALEEEYSVAKATITKYNRELEDQKGFRQFKEESDRKLFSVQRELNKREAEVKELREDLKQLAKLQEDLNQSEKMVEQLENKLSEYSVEIEKGNVASTQLESYRDQLRDKTKENRDMSLYIHELESQLKDLPYLQTRLNEVSDELNDANIKLEKIPGLLSEQAKLRGNNRASLKALAEQDKILGHFKSRVKELEKDNTLLQAENGYLKELETKLSEANDEIKRLMSLVSEVHTLKAGVKNAEEEKKSIESQYKKMRKFMRQSVITSGASVSAMMVNNHSMPTSTANFSETGNDD